MRSNEPIAVVGMGAIFPQAPSVARLWQNIVSGLDTCRDVPSHRWVLSPDLAHRPGERPGPDRVASRRACLVDRVEVPGEGWAFDPSLLEELDPTCLLALAASREACDDAGRGSLEGATVGVVLASIALPTDGSSALTRQVHGRVLARRVLGKATSSVLGPLEPPSPLESRVVSLPAAIVARGLGFGGGTLTLDAACASSLYAIKLACDELREGRASAMLAGGVCRPDCLYTQMGFTALQALSPSGRCAPFDARADGLVVGEGAGVLVLKRLSVAIADGNRIHGLIHAIGLSNDVGGSLLAPDAEGQLRAMRAAYAEAGWSPHDVDLVECHGTGTPTGDRVELRSLRELWGDDGWAPGQCGVGSVKSMVGHTLTAAGAAGLIKVLLGLRHQTLPPTANFEQPPADARLAGGPFRIQAGPAPWPRREATTPRRAAVSAFGFGGINAHLLVSEYEPGVADAESHVSLPTAQVEARREAEAPREVEEPIAIVGMACHFGHLASLRAFQESVLRGASALVDRPAGRWHDADDVLADLAGAGEPPGALGAYVDHVDVPLGRYRIPPTDIPGILPQQLLMLDVAARALDDAGLDGRVPHRRAGVLVGISLDLDTTTFQLRWAMPAMAAAWADALGMSLSADDMASWVESLRDAASPGLDANRTVGALGSIVASRIAREFSLGGPSYAVSAEEASGVRALEIAVRALRRGEMDWAVAAAVDLAGDGRLVAAADGLLGHTPHGRPRPFDAQADGVAVGEGAVALVLKRLSDARAAGDRIYAVIRGVGVASEGGVDHPAPAAEGYRCALERAYRDAGLEPGTVSYVEAHASGHAEQDRVEQEALLAFFGPGERPCAIGSLAPVIGRSGAAAGLASVAKAALCLFQEIVPAVPTFTEPAMPSAWEGARLHVPIAPLAWKRDRVDGPRRAGVSSMTTDGNCTHVVLEGLEMAPGEHAEARRQPLGPRAAALFAISGESRGDLERGLDDLRRHLEDAPRTMAGVEDAARRWLDQGHDAREGRLALALVVTDPTLLSAQLQDARDVLSRPGDALPGLEARGIFSSACPLGPEAPVAFVFPGSGNHYAGMGRSLGVEWPEVIRALDADSERLATHLVEPLFAPCRWSWEPGWEVDAAARIAASPLAMIMGQVMHGVVVADVAGRLGLRPRAVIGYSLGESAALFATRAWRARDEMYRRLRDTELFRTQLAGRCTSAREAYGVPEGEEWSWRVVVVNRPSSTVREVLAAHPSVALLIVNTDNECVIGGERRAVAAVVDVLACDAFEVEGVTTVHCSAVEPVADAYRALHVFDVFPPEGIRFYSGSWARAFEVGSDSAADSIIANARHGIDYPATIRAAYEDGARVFLEMGPQGSCTRMIRRILADRPHLARSLCVQGEDGAVTVLKTLASLVAERVPVDLRRLYPPVDEASKASATTSRGSVLVPVGRRLPPVVAPPRAAAPAQPGPTPAASPVLAPAPSPNPASVASQPPLAAPGTSVAPPVPTPSEAPAPWAHAMRDLEQRLAESHRATAEAHEQFLRASQDVTRGMGQAIGLQTLLLQAMVQADPAALEASAPAPGEAPASAAPGGPAVAPAARPALDYAQCLEFARGSIGAVLGEAFSGIDLHPTRVRLPDEPLMLCHRIMTIEGEPRSLSRGRLVTEHDVAPGAWYLDGNCAPVFVSVEAGQADLFLSAWLGIDFVTKGERVYRLLDATVRFHRPLPRPGETIRYDIRIDRFVRQGDVHLFFFEFDGTVDGQPLLTMRNGCAGFFTPQEIADSRGIVLTEEETAPAAGRRPADWADLVPMDAPESYSDEQVLALRRGDLEGCFGPGFAGLPLARPVRLPDGLLKLFDRVLSLEPRGGRFGLGCIRAEADVHPDDWFLTCHFVDDMVMPGTLMYECCAHALRFLLLRTGWVGEDDRVSYEPVLDVPAVLKCRGPVTVHTRKVTYEVEIKEIGYDPEPYVIADALMYADGKRIVRFVDMSMRMRGQTRQGIEAAWRGRHVAAPSDPSPLVPSAGPGQGPRYEQKPAVYDNESIMQFAVGRPSLAFGPPYAVFDEGRRCARLPGPPYKFLDRITEVGQVPYVCQPGGWTEAQYDIPLDEWYFAANRQPCMPFAVLLEVALQPCGWLAAYVGSALGSPVDLHFRNLGGCATLYEDVFPHTGTLTTRVRLTNSSEAGGMIVQNYDFLMTCQGRRIYEGTTSFGFFSSAALAHQLGVRDAASRVHVPSPEELARALRGTFPRLSPLSPDDPRRDVGPAAALPAKAFLMMDGVDVFVPDGGPAGLGFIRGVKDVDPGEWFFKAHFYQDPVWPGSLGLEAFIQLLKHVALHHFGERHAATHRFECIRLDVPHTWVYRGQVIPTNRRVEVEACITALHEDPVPTVVGNGFLRVDGLNIYEMKDFGLRMVPATT